MNYIRLLIFMHSCRSNLESYEKRGPQAVENNLKNHAGRVDDATTHVGAPENGIMSCRPEATKSIPAPAPAVTTHAKRVYHYHTFCKLSAKRLFTIS